MAQGSREDPGPARLRPRMLELGFSTRAGRVELHCGVSDIAALNALRTRFSTAVVHGNQHFDIDIDDLLLNLVELARWPGGDVQWRSDLRTLVETNAADASRMRGWLAPGPTAIEQPPPAMLPNAWHVVLTEFQQRDLAKLLQLSHGANFSVPGAGKTRVTLAAFSVRRKLGQVRRMLVVCPKSAFAAWKEEALVCPWDEPVRVGILDSDSPPECDILLVNYERIPDSKPVLLQWLRAQPTMLVLDEAHRTKLGPAGAWGTTCLSLGPYAVSRMILTGTPAPNGAQDLENLFSFVWPGQGRRTVSSALAGNDLRSASRMLRPLFVRTTKNELNLPPAPISVRRIDLPPLHRELYDALLGQMSARWRGGEDDAAALGRIVLYLLMAATTPALLAVGATRYEPLPYRIPPIHPPEGSTLSMLMRDLPHYELSPKYQEVAGIVAVNAALGRKTLVWSTFVRNLTSLGHLLDHFEPAIVHGGTEDRDNQLRRFRTDPDCMVLLSNPATLGEGVSLHHECHDAVYLDRDFAAGKFMQSLDRIHRLGLAPDTETRITVLVANGTIDEVVEQRLNIKLRFMGGVLDDPAVLQLADLDEEPTETAGMDSGDFGALVGYLGADPS